MMEYVECSLCKDRGIISSNINFVKHEDSYLEIKTDKGMKMLPIGHCSSYGYIKFCPWCMNDAEGE